MHWLGMHWPVMELKRIKTNTRKQNKKQKTNPRQMLSTNKIRQIITKIMEYTHTHTHTHTKSRLTQQAKETKNDINQLKTKLTKAQTRKQNQRKVSTGEYSNENKTYKHGDKKKEYKSKLY